MTWSAAQSVGISDTTLNVNIWLGFIELHFFGCLPSILPGELRSVLFLIFPSWL